MAEVTNVLHGTLAALRESEIDLLADIAQTLVEMSEASQEDQGRLMEMVRDLQEMFFLVVIIGEFNAGKSSFINALIGENLLPTGITPTTEVIEVVRYSETPVRKPIMRDDSLREWGHPNTGAEGVAIVDTPGTGSIFRRHEETAKAFLHRSDMVIFLLSAKRAFAETERIYLEMAKDFGKKVILVVNQIDLLEPAEQTQVRRFIEQQVKNLLGIQPLLFMVSAKEAQQESGQGLGGGIDAVRAHLRGVFAEASPAKQKLLAQLNTAARITDKYHDIIRGKAKLVKADTSRVREVQQELEEQSLGLDAQLTEARAEVDRVFEAMRTRGLNFINVNLSLRKLGRSPSREKLHAEFQDVVIGRAMRDITEASGGYINAVVDQSRVYWRSVIDRLNQLRDLLDQEFGNMDANLYSEQRESLEEAIRIAEAELKSYSSGRLVDEIRQDFQANMSGFTWSALASVGGLVAALLATVGTPGPVIGATAAPLALPALLIAAPLAAVGSMAALHYYRRISRNARQEFNERVDRLMETYHSALDDLTRRERSRLSQYGNQVLTPIFSRLEVLARRYAEQETRFDQYQKRIRTLREGIESA